jgi:hypothetical protein
MAAFLLNPHMRARHGIVHGLAMSSGAGRRYDIPFPARMPYGVAQLPYPDGCMLLSPSFSKTSPASIQWPALTISQTYLQAALGPSPPILCRVFPGLQVIGDDAERVRPAMWMAGASGQNWHTKTLRGTRVCAPSSRPVPGVDRLEGALSPCAIRPQRAQPGMELCGDGDDGCARPERLA